MARRKPQRSGVSLGVYVGSGLFDALDKYVEGSRPRTTKTAIVEMLIERFLTEQGCWPPANGEPPPPERTGKRGRPPAHT